MQPSLESLGQFETKNGRKYITQLCKHFAHKVEAVSEGDTGRAALPPGPCSMEASEDLLKIRVTAADAEGLKTAKYIIDSHLQRFAFRESFEAMEWD